MEGNLPAGSMIPGVSYGMLGLQGNMHNHQSSMIHQSMHDDFPMSGNHLQGSDHRTGASVMDYSKGQHNKTSVSDDDEPSFNDDAGDGHQEAGKGRKGSPWHRMKWTDRMVKLLITAVSYIGEDATSECGGRRKYAILQKKGKWKAISKVMAERGCYVSPQQCEDKFNDLNKRYKRLTDILGRGTSCKVVENPALLNRMNNLSEKMKEDVRKILSSKHLFYEEMCSYHNCNRLNLPADPALQHSLQLALRSRDEHDTRRGSHEDVDEDDQSSDSDDEEGDAEEHNAVRGDVSCFPKRMKLGVDHEAAVFGNPSASHGCGRGLQPQGLAVDMNQVLPDGSKSTLGQQQWDNSYSLQLEEKRLQIQAEMLELEKQRYKWQRFSKKKDRELNKMRMENERMKLENERMSLELRQKEIEMDLMLKRT
ncbi:uncharacterized protein LOC122015226 [Zingiber officinale]|uniref:Myb/SANT-like DNA-binding domain-containing protein n=1 Tax=Zingiber officinale TaxID=94328 RepID=A0A8J5F6F8_ZINOF|nr:uncharacterized protein LOC122008230 [Zingiber officinale]XP_042419815.1 uncharacterized protein LOC122008230 [Zingiber officinale]XP_042427927.1 uncharacterized protein LOC122015226 [Zingiber officinale]XP_042427929.1 uncharacterized protein LOC122015226 [Zingiber officinale]KAG6481916.1 hypothetical protein ZIOFF_058540 [Zingiber officinale]KAG6485770.1 hypothetical protein ZIOFF_054335 [Zingiber officinale]